jgi:hypothetical protein
MGTFVFTPPLILRFIRRARSRGQVALAVLRGLANAIPRPNNPDDDNNRRRRTGSAPTGRTVVGGAGVLGGRDLAGRAPRPGRRALSAAAVRVPVRAASPRRARTSGS